ncbi:hypothetical protein CRN79_08695 [Serratia fonticola]|uniref:response regulator transcription factor n=1 Tax=Serratia fonticola TaxID=47917 RepID=UPI000BFDCDE5|nr:response regulator transcription factor [Serratia fonticola]ATM75905.1 hypothetical protein CRN79_08695 [Serratia fonticola]
MNTDIHSSVNVAWEPKRVVIFDKNFLSRNAAHAILKDVYPESMVSDSEELSDAITLLEEESKLQLPCLLIIDFSGDQEAPLIFFNKIKCCFLINPNLKVVVYTSVEDCFFIASISSFISGGVLLKKESMLSMKKMLHSLRTGFQVVFSASVNQLIGDYRMPSVSPKALQGYFAEIAEHQLLSSSVKIGSKYKTFCTRRYSTLEKLGFKRVRQYYTYLSKINNMLYR